MAAGDIRRSFDFGDPILIHEASVELFNEISAQRKKEKIDLISSKNHHLVKSLPLLVEYLSSPNPLLSRICGSMLVQFAKTDAMDIEFAQQQLLNAAKVAQCPISILHSLTDLSIFLSKSGRSAVKRIHQHPLVQFHQIRKSSISDLLDSLDKLGNSVGFTAVLAPMALLLLVPDTEESQKYLIFDWLLKHAEKGEIGMAVVSRILGFIPRADNRILRQICDSQKLNDRLREELVFEALENLAGMVGRIDFGAEMEFLGKSVPLLKPNSLNRFSLRFSTMLQELPFDYWKQALKIVEHAWNHSCVVYANLFFTSLVNTMSMIQRLKTLGLLEEESMFLAKSIQGCLAAVQSRSQKIECAVHKAGGSMQSTADVLCRFPETIRPFLRALQHLSIHPNVPNLNLLCSILVLHQDDKKIAGECCSVMEKLLNKDPSKVSMVLPAFIQAASKELMANGPSETAVVLNSLPKLAVHHLNTPTVLRFILGLSSNPKTRESGYRLLGSLYEKQPFIYRQVKALLDDAPRITDAHLAVMKMELVLVVCKVSGADHGDDLASLLTSVLNKHVDLTSEIAVKTLPLAVLAIGELCRWEVLQPDIIWRKLYGKLAKSRGPLLSALCDFGGIIGEIMEADGEEASGDWATCCGEILQFLLKTASSQSMDSGCRTVALRALSKYDYRRIERSQLGIQERKPEGESESVEEEKKGIPGEMLFSVLESLGNENLDAFTQLLSKSIDSEVETLGRGAYYNAKLLASKQSATSSSLDEFCASLSAKCSQEDGCSDVNIAVAALLVYEPLEELSSRGGDVTRKSMISAGRQYLRMLTELIKSVPFEDVSNGKRAFIVPFGWIKFMERLYLSVITSRKVEVELAKGIDKQRELRVAHLWARDKVVEILKSAWKQDNDARPNICVALASLGLAVKSYVSSTVLSADDSTTQSYMDNRHWITLAVETMFGFAMTDYSPTSQDLFFELLDAPPDSSLTSASRLGISILLPAVREDVASFYDDGVLHSFQHALSDSSTDQSPEANRSMEFYDSMALGFFHGGLAQSGMNVDHSPFLCADRYRTAGGWLGAVIAAVYADDVRFSESLLNVLSIAVLDEAYDSNKIDGKLVLTAIALVTLVLYPDPNQFVRSELWQCLRGSERFGTNDENQPGFIGKILSTVDKEKYRRSVRDRLGKLETTTTYGSDVADEFRWLCSSSGSDYFPFAMVGRGRRTDAEDRSILNELCKFTKSLSKKEIDDRQLKGECVFSLACVAFSTKLAQSDSSDSTLPTDYGYLDESSVLRHSIGFLLGGKRTLERVRSVLNGMLSPSRKKLLPPFDWERIYDSLNVEIRSQLDESLVKLAVKERSIALLAKFAHPTIAIKMSSAAKLRLLENLHVLASVLPLNGFRRFVKIVPQLDDGGADRIIFVSAFEGLRSTFESSTAAEEDGPRISPGNLDASRELCIDLCQRLRVMSYNDFRTAVVQSCVEAFVAMDSRTAEEKIAGHSETITELSEFAIRIPAMVRRHRLRGEKSAMVQTMARLVEEYSEMDISIRPSALRILTHELASASLDETDRENNIIHLMNSVLVYCKKTEDSHSIAEFTKRASAEFDVFLAAATVWYENDFSIPSCLLGETTAIADGLDTNHDAEVVRKVIFTDTPDQFARSLREPTRRKLLDKVIDWAFQLLQYSKILGEKHTDAIKAIIRRSRSSESYSRKLQDSAMIEQILTDGCGVKIS